MINKPKFKIARRLGPGVFDKTQTPKFNMVKGIGTKRPKALSEYGIQFLEKQKVRFSYGITERQLSNYVREASKLKGAGTVEKFFEELETRLDNVIYRMGLASSRRGARQMASHGHFVINGKRTTVPSYRIKVGDTITVREGSKGKKIFSNLIDKMKDYTAPAWLSFNIDKMEGKILAKPKNAETFIDFNAVLEFYSR